MAMREAPIKKNMDLKSMLENVNKCATRLTKKGVGMRSD